MPRKKCYFRFVDFELCLSSSNHELGMIQSATLFFIIDKSLYLSNILNVLDMNRLLYNEVNKPMLLICFHSLLLLQYTSSPSILFLRDLISKQQPD